MGLDSFAKVRGPGGEWEAAPDEPFAGIRLVGGFYSGGVESASMRGKLYADVVEAATGESLYQPRIEPGAVAEMARRLRAAVEEAKRAGTAIDSDQVTVLDVAGQEIDSEEAEHLARWFEVCAKHGYAVDGWW